MGGMRQHCVCSPFIECSPAREQLRSREGLRSVLGCRSAVEPCAAQQPSLSAVSDDEPELHDVSATQAISLEASVTAAKLAVSVPSTEKDAMIKADAIRLGNATKDTIYYKVYNGGDSICLVSSDAAELPAGKECIAQASPDEAGNVQVYIWHEYGTTYHVCKVGETFSITQETLTAGKLVMVENALKTQHGQQHGCAGLTEQEFECADHMLKMCRQYLRLVAKKLRFELPKMVFSDLLHPASHLESRLKAIIRDEYTSIIESMCSEPTEAREKRAGLETRVSALDKVAMLLKSSEFSVLTEGAVSANAVAAPQLSMSLAASCQA